MATVKIPEAALRELWGKAADVVTAVVKKLAEEMTVKRFDNPAFRDLYSEEKEGETTLKTGDQVTIKKGGEFEIVFRL